jgi:hypothetical protein
VFVRHGEPAERIPFGHLEPLERFASRHGLPVTQLLRELSEAAGVPVAWQAAREERVHRPFLTAALLITLSLGAGWGAVLLWRIGWHMNFDAVPARDVVAHGDAQLWGFIAMFIAGVALRWLPVATATRFVPDLHARIIFAGFLVGVVGGFVWALHAASAPWLATFSGMGLTAAAYLMANFLISRVVFRGKEVWVWAVIAAGVWWVVWAAYTLYLRWKYEMLGPDSYSLIERNATIYLAVFAVALNAVFGFGLRLLPGIVGGRVDRFWAILAILLHNFSLVVFFASMINGWRTLTLISPVGIVIGVLCYCCALPGLRQLKRFADRPEQGPSGLVWYVPVAFAWLILGGMLILLGHAYELKEGVVVSHAWYGAARHALTVGFLTTLIMGVAQRLLPILGHVLIPWPRFVVPALVLVSFGALLRVTTELATMVHPLAFRLMPISSLLELAALALVAANCFRTLWPPRDPLLTTGRAALHSSVAILLAEHPWLEDELIRWGFDYLARTRSVPRELTLQSMSLSHKINPEYLLDRINAALAEKRQRSS